MDASERAFRSDILNDARYEGSVAKASAAYAPVETTADEPTIKAAASRAAVFFITISPERAEIGPEDGFIAWRRNARKVIPETQPNDRIISSGRQILPPSPTPYSIDFKRLLRGTRLA